MISALIRGFLDVLLPFFMEDMLCLPIRILVYQRISIYAFVCMLFLYLFIPCLDAGKHKEIGFFFEKSI